MTMETAKWTDDFQMIQMGKSWNSVILHAIFC